VAELPQKVRGRCPVSRHCERSEAIHGSAQRDTDCFVAALLAMTVKRVGLAGRSAANSGATSRDFRIALRCACQRAIRYSRDCEIEKSGGVLVFQSAEQRQDYILVRRRTLSNL
jgi:hypothetical protein